MQGVFTGIMLAKGVAAHQDDQTHADASRHSQLAPGRAQRRRRPHHQHFFNFRLDLDVDGPVERRQRDQRAGGACRSREIPPTTRSRWRRRALRTELEARRDLNLASARRWLIVNPGRAQRPGPDGRLPARARARTRCPTCIPNHRSAGAAAFIDHHFWATPFDPAEQHAAGEYPNQSEPGEGLPKWTARDRPLEGQDVVAWYTFGITHIPRPEEWPIMSAQTAGFKLVPVSFFSRNPALDVPRR